jgi:hypothetical protein
MSDHAQSICPPPESDRMLRYTWLSGFDEPAPLTLLEQLGATLGDYAREAGMWSTDMAAEPLAAIAEDLDSLAACLTEVRDAPTDSRPSPTELVLCRQAGDWADTVCSVVAEIRGALAADGGEVA